MTLRRAQRAWWALGWLLLLPMLPAAVAADDCGDDVAVVISPRAPVAGERVRILAASDTGRIGDLLVSNVEGGVVSSAVRRLGGPPWSASVALADAASGTFRVEAMRDGRAVGCATFHVTGPDERRRVVAAPSARGWDRASEALYSAWIEHLFDAPPDVALSFDTLQEVLTDPERNLLHDYFGMGEDDARGALGAPPDCADLAYVLRAYFGWKLGLPIGFRQCSRGTARTAPTCGEVKIASPREATDLRGWYARVAAQVMGAVHSGSARTALGDEATDFYPVALTRAALRPGTIYADPYGHTLMIVGWVPQTTERSGMLLAVDAQPDNSVARKRFWEGTFLFANDVKSAGPGFKAFRPLVAAGGGAVRPLTNDALAADAGRPDDAASGDDSGFAPYSIEQRLLSPDEFYARVGRLIAPDGLRPLQAYDETLDALVEQLTTRVDSVQRGEDYMRAHPPETIDMPDGPAIFETLGPWEDYATPSRDFRLLIAMKVLLDLPERLGRHPELYLLDGRPAAEARIVVEQRHGEAIAERGISYVRSDGSRWRLTVADLLARRDAFEMAYNPNDCIEVRWGAEPGTDEYETCRRHAPAAQRARMETYREWFRDGRRPER
jgi:hypothetical protein